MKKKKEIKLNIENPTVIIENKIYVIRGQKVMLDKDLAEIYGVSTKVLNQAVKRNKERFPGDFMFQLNSEEILSLRSQIVMSNIENGNRSQFVTGSQKHRDPRFLPYTFTEHGTAMLSSVLKSERAVQMNIFIIRAFIKIRELFSLSKDLAEKVGVLEREQIKQGKIIIDVYRTLKRFEKEPPSNPSPIGFNLPK